MSNAAEIEKSLSQSECPLPDNLFSQMEKLSIWIVTSFTLLLTLGLIFANDLIWDDGLKSIIWDPIVKDAGAAGDAGYSPQNTAIYAFTILLAVVVLQAVFRKMNLPADDKMMIALITWVFLAPVLRVLEDSDFFSSKMDWLLISPIIHFHLALWLVLTATISHKLASKWDGSQIDKDVDKSRTILFISLGFLLYLHWAVLYRPGYIEHQEIGLFWIILGLAVSFILLFMVLVWTWKWPAITRGLVAFGTSATVLGFFHWLQFLATPWQQESGRIVESQPLWPLFVVLGLPGIICWVMYRYGIDDARHLRLTGYQPGVLPDGISLKTWEDAEKTVAEHPIEQLSKKALLANPMVLAMVFGQLCDGFATMIGIDFFGYGEKHPVSNAVIQFGGEINDTVGISWGEGAWFFALIKAILVAVIVWLFIEMRVERRQVHMRILIVLAVLIVGLAPGLRDIGRLTLDV
jgi:uncharacterized membrane protein